MHCAPLSAHMVRNECAPYGLLCGRRIAPFRRFAIVGTTVLGRVGVSLDFLFSLTIAALTVWIVIWLWIVLPYRMAERRKRDGFVWVAISIIGTPLLAILLLLVAGERET
jgi:hypothetical protein